MASGRITVMDSTSDSNDPVQSDNTHNNFVPRLSKNQMLRSFLSSESSDRRLRDCSQWRQCGRRFCPWCASRIARRDYAQLVDSFPSDQAVVELVLSLRSNQDLAEAWNAQSNVRSEFLRNRWLTGRCDGWLRHTHVTVSAFGWHVHDHVLIRGSSGGLAAVATQRWRDSARRRKEETAREAIRGWRYADGRSRLGYVLRPATSQKSERYQHGFSIGDVLATYQAGEADSYEWWQELEAFLGSGTRHRWIATGGSVKRIDSTERISDSSLNQHTKSV